MHYKFAHILVVTFVCHVQGARILGLFSHFGKSHHMVFEPLLKTLAERGHHLTVATLFPLENPPLNYTQLSFAGLTNAGLEVLDLKMYENPNFKYRLPIIGDIWKQADELKPIVGWALSMCDKLKDWPPLVKLLEMDYDLVIVENFNSDCMLGLLHIFDIKAPVVALSSCNAMPWSAERLGFVDNPSYVPVVTSPWSAPMTYVKRFQNSFLNIYLQYIFRYNIQEKEREMIESHYGRTVPLHDLSKNLSLFLVNTFHALNGVRPSVPGRVEVGGMHLDDNRKHIPEYLEISAGSRRYNTQCSARHTAGNMRSTLVIFAVIALHNVQAARILGLFPHTGKSHQMVFEPLLKKLAERGHQVTVASFFPLKNPPSNYTDVSFEGIAGLGVETFSLTWLENPGLLFSVPIMGDLLAQIGGFTPLAGMALNVCSKALDWPPLVDALKLDYDVVLVENFNSDCMLGLLHIYGVKAPVVALSSSSAVPWAAERIGFVDNPSYLPVISSHWTHPMTFLEKLKNTFMNVFFKVWFHYEVHEKEREMLEKHYGRKVPLDQLSKNFTLLMVNTFHPLNGVRPSVPGLIEVGGMHLDNSRQHIPHYIERFLNESEHGVVIFSFGSLIKTATIPKYKEEIITSALSKLKQRVIWKYEDSAEEGTLTGNILRVRWLPQYELLRHKKVVAFLAHGGLLGMTEAVSAGKPMVVVPFFGDQPSNGAAAEAAGLAKVVSYSDLTEDSLSAALEKVLSAEMRLQARQLSKIWNDRQNPPLDTAVYWVERVIRWGPAAKLHSPARDMPFYQVALLDVAAAYIALVLTMIALMWFTISRISRLFIREGKQKIH
ncbi:unnamed protein product [Leptosia nina]|uniref:UDP-glycosyltransferase n=1 Tax=Leptosia nina TaxID=320188 RepID=A0AAV1IXN9_9NEOP